MYKLLLCWRYLCTRYIALASIISVMLGVATMIVVNSVMSGFTTEMQNRIHGILSDVVIDSRNLSGFPDAQWHMEKIWEAAGDSIQGMTATVVVPAMLNFQYNGNWITRQVQLIGIDAETQSQVSEFAGYLQHPGHRKKMEFKLQDGGYDTRDHQEDAETPERWQMKDAGWTHRCRMAWQKSFDDRSNGRDAEADGPPDEEHTGFSFQPWGIEEQSGQVESDNVKHATVEPTPSDVFCTETPVATSRSTRADPRVDPRVDPSLEPEKTTARLIVPQPEQPLRPAKPQQPKPSADVFAARAQGESEDDPFDPAKEQHTGAALGIALAMYRDHDGRDNFLLLPGDDVKLTFPTAGTPPKAVSDTFTVVDFYESKMSEYDSQFVFVPIEKLQELRGMIDPSTGVAMVNSIQIKLKPGVDGVEVRDKLQKTFSPALYVVSTWKDKQGALLAAVNMETAILNVLLFLIIAVAGFGILAIFLMIVVEKTRDIGILKSLGASGVGIMGIFLAYGLSLGLMGSGVGLVLGLLFVRCINQIADLLGWITGQPVFDPSIYYFYKIPTIVDPWTITWIVLGALTIAVLASILPALRAALLHPVEALRYE